ncbi:immunoglobulin superfamily member 2 [Elgaria multicarinata webbii]|uniref:immunoglobulin superfamily member 2 n=1 Tax=Elgaria multicarinata webbii TaxID=159646 RepID=UPI002FCD22A7
MGSIQYLTTVFLLLFDLSAGMRMVSIQKGRLYRARGYHITIWCNVSGYQGPQEQNFQWSIRLPSVPGTLLQVVSTSEASFSYAVYSQRVRSGEIYIERIQGDSVLLHITDLKDQDAGEYECHTPNTDDAYLGAYSAKMNLSVIPDALSATMKTQALFRDQGESLELLCEVTTATAEHTHLSVAWFLIQGGDRQTQKILSLSREFVLLPGSSFAQRFSSGDIRLDKIGEKAYKLSIANLQPSDQGEVYCEAVEWIQDPDETWKDIARKQTSRTSLTIRNMDKNVYVNISVAESSLLEGEALQITCSIQAQNTRHRRFQVVWQHHGKAVASIDQYGALSFPSDNEARFSVGNLLVKKQSNDEYIFRISRVELKDKGTHRCQVSEMEKTPTGSFAITEQRSSPGIDINVKPRESHLQLFVWVKEETIMEGEALAFSCKGSVAENLLSVNWWHIQKDGSPPLLIAGMDQDGRIKIGPSYVERSAQGELQLEKVDSAAFTLTIYNTLATNDTGLYRCELTEWSKGRSWEHTQEISTKVQPLGLNLKAVLSSRIPNVKLHEDFELFCKVSANNITAKVPISITWYFQPSSGLGGSQQVVKVTAGGAIVWNSAHLHFQKKTKIAKSSFSSQLLIHSATWQDAGLYRCKAEVWRNSGRARDLEAPAVVSNPVAIMVTKPESRLGVNTDAKTLEISSNENAAVDCKIMSLTNANSQLEVSWYFLPSLPMDASPRLIIRNNYSNVVEYGEAFSSPHQKSRFHSEKVSNHLYQLLILSADYDVQGKYYCTVDESIWSIDGSWNKLGKMESGNTTVRFKISENKPRVEGTNHSMTATEKEDVTLKCILQSPVQPTSHFSISWFKVSGHSKTETLVTIKNNGVIEYGSGKAARRLRPHGLSVGDFRLTLQNVEMVDAGLFYCQVDEWQDIDCSGAQVQHASSQSGYSSLIVLPSASTSSTQICSSPSLYYFIIFYPLVLFLILMTVFLLCLKTKLFQKTKLNLEGKKTSGEEIEIVAPTHFEHRSMNNVAEEEIHSLKSNDIL